jgi:hypothetical protein
MEDGVVQDERMVFMNLVLGLISQDILVLGHTFLDILVLDLTYVWKLSIMNGNTD